LKKLARGIKNSHNFIVTIPVPVRTPDGKGFFKAGYRLVHTGHRMLFLSS